MLVKNYSDAFEFVKVSIKNTVSSFRTPCCSSDASEYKQLKQHQDHACIQMTTEVTVVLSVTMYNASEEFQPEYI